MNELIKNENYELYPDKITPEMLGIDTKLLLASSRTRVYREYDYSDEYWMASMTVNTYVIFFNEDGTELIYGASYFNEASGDVFSKKKGRDIALVRAVVNPRTINIVDAIKSYVKDSFIGQQIFDIWKYNFDMDGTTIKFDMSFFKWKKDNLINLIKKEISKTYRNYISSSNAKLNEAFRNYANASFQERFNVKLEV